MASQSTISLVVVFFILSLSNAANADSRFESINKRLDDLEKMRNEVSNKHSAYPDELYIYGTLRPTVFFRDDGDARTLDVGDALSRIGFRGAIDLTNSMKGFFEGEWSIDLSDNGDFGKARKALVGISGKYGTAAIGKQRTPHYLLIAEPVDIFNHANSPFAYDNVGTFFSNNQVTYQYQQDGFRLLSSVRVNGDEGDDKSDMINVGASYANNHAYFALAYLRNIEPSATDSLGEGDEVTNIAATSSVSFGDFYLAVAYQNIETETNTDDIDGRTIDISGSMKLPNSYKVKAGVFSYDDGLDTGSNENRGWNLTLEKQFNSQFRAHIEYLVKDFNESGIDNISDLTVGLRYDFERIID